MTLVSAFRRSLQSRAARPLFGDAYEASTKASTGSSPTVRTVAGSRKLSQCIQRCLYGLPDVIRLGG